jgi:hypothetical protein
MQNKIKIMFLAIIVLAAITGLVIWDVPIKKAALIWEKPTIEQTARAYFEAERERNLEKVYAFLAPSSVYRKTHSYNEFLREVEKSSKKISTFRIVDIYRLRGNDNRETYPLVDKFVQVEVDITFTDTGENSIYNYCFTFLKEKGIWYKG